MKYLVLVLLIQLAASFSFADTREDNLAHLNKVCNDALTKKMALDKAKSVCACVNHKITKKLSEKQVEHLFLVSLGHRDKSQLPVDEGVLVEDYEAQVSLICLKQYEPRAIPADSLKTN